MPFFCADRNKNTAFYARTPPESVPPSAEVERMRWPFTTCTLRLPRMAFGVPPVPFVLVPVCFTYTGGVGEQHYFLCCSLCHKIRPAPRFRRPNRRIVRHSPSSAPRGALAGWICSELFFTVTEKGFAIPVIFFTLCAEKVCYKLCNMYYKLANMCYKLCNMRYKVCNKNFLIG